MSQCFCRKTLSFTTAKSSILYISNYFVVWRILLNYYLNWSYFITIFNILCIKFLVVFSSMIVIQLISIYDLRTKTQVDNESVSSIMCDVLFVCMTYVYMSNHLTVQSLSRYSRFSPQSIYRKVLPGVWSSACSVY